MHTDHSGIQRIMSVKSTFSHQGITNRCIHFGSQLPHFLGSTGDNSTAAHINERFFAGFNHFCNSRKLRIRVFTLGNFGLYCLCFIFTFVGGNILCNVYQYRTRSSGTSNFKGFTDGICKDRNILYNVSVLCNWHSYTGNINLLERIFSQSRQIYITGNGYHRNRIHIGCSNACNQIGGTGAACSHTNTHLAGSSGITVCRMGSSLLMRS